MSGATKKSPKDMSNDELSARFMTLQWRIGRFNKSMPWISGSCYAGAVLLAAGAAIVGLPGAMMIFAVGCGLGSGFMGLGTMVRDTYWEDEASNLKNENNTRFIIAEAQHQRAEAKAAKDLKEQFKAAITAVTEGRGIDRDLKVGKPLQLKSKSLFGIFAS
jgi:hypothetical protein